MNILKDLGLSTDYPTIFRGHSRNPHEFVDEEHARRVLAAREHLRLEQTLSASAPRPEAPCSAS